MKVYTQTNEEVSRLLKSVAAAYEVKEEKSYFQVTAYKKAADAISQITIPLGDL